MIPWNLISFEYMQSMTTKIKANKISKTPNTIDHTEPSNALTIEVAKVNTAKTNNIMIATTNESIGVNLGKQ